MPTIITSGVATARGYGTFGGGRVIAPDTAIRYKTNNAAGLGQQYTTTISLLAGYSAGIYIYMVGDATVAGPSCCGNCGRSASGENAQFAYTCTGSETGLQLTFNTNGNNSANNYFRCTIVGGPNNGKSAFVGSWNSDCGYGNAAAPTSRVSGSDPVFTVVTSGAYAASYGNYYGDGYFYSSCGNQYGNGLNGYTADGQTWGAWGGCSSGQVGAMWLQYRNNY